MESRGWGQCQRCRKRGYTFYISQDRDERLCEECSWQHAPWIDDKSWNSWNYNNWAKWTESTWNPRHSNDWRENAGRNLQSTHEEWNSEDWRQSQNDWSGTQNSCSQSTRERTTTDQHRTENNVPTSVPYHTDSQPILLKNDGMNDDSRSPSAYGGKAAYKAQQALRRYCLQNNLWHFDLNHDHH